MQQLMQHIAVIATANATRYEKGFEGSERLSTFALSERNKRDDGVL